MVVDLKNYLERILVELGAATIKHREKVSGFLLDNEWFGVSINLDDYTITEKDAEVLKNHIKDYLTTPPGIKSMEGIFSKKFPSTSELFVQFAEEEKLSETNRFYLLDFLAYYLTKDLFLYSEARRTLLSITTRLTYLNLTPNKTKNASNVAQLKFHVPESCQVLIGTLLAICEAHFQLQIPYNAENPLIRQIKTYEKITSYMGEEVGNLFLERNFSSRSANKSYLQSVAMLADDVLEEKSELNIKGYFLAALARSHKGDFNEFAQTTTTYLKDAQLGQLKPEMVAKELFERGVLSMIPSMLLTIVTRGKYKKLSPSQQTQMIKSLDLTPVEIEKTLELSIRADLRSQQALKTLVENNVEPEQLLTICHRIGNGEAFSKQGESMCLLSALGKLCPYDDRQHCVGCQYELQTKSTLLLLIGEFNRLNKQYQKLKNELERGKVRAILEQQIKPCLTEMLEALSEQYGEAVLSDYEDIIKELVS